MASTVPEETGRGVERRKIQTNVTVAPYANSFHWASMRLVIQEYRVEKKKPESKTGTNRSTVNKRDAMFNF